MSDIILAGVGGQGCVLASRLIASCAIADSISAHSAETIGMAQRGGSVVSHVRIGEDAISTIIPYGSADVIIGFEPAEALRNIVYLKKNGVVIVNDAPVKPVTDALSNGDYDAKNMIEYLKKLDIKLYVVSASAIAEKCGSSKVMNMVLLGAACGLNAIGIKEQQLINVMKASTKPQYFQMNLNAVEMGIKSVKPS